MYSIKNYYKSITSEAQLKQLLYDNGPIGVSVYSRDAAFRYFGGGGVLNACTNKTSIDHVVLLVGWTTRGWIIKNSWGTGWGDNGYATIDYKNNCGIDIWVDVLSMDPTILGTTVGAAPQTSNMSRECVVTMEDHSGDGWNGYFFTVMQGQSIVSTFGSDFTSGRTHGPQEILIPLNK